VPRRAAPGDAERIEAVLADLTLDAPTMLAALDEVRVWLNIYDWQSSPLAAPFQQVAAIVVAARMVRDGKVSEKDALDHAAARLGLRPDTLRSRSKRWPLASRALCTPTSQDPGRTLEDNEHPDREAAA
jgi:hypothetical protein